MARSGFKMKGYSYPGSSMARDEKTKGKEESSDKDVVVEGGLVKSQGMINLEANEPSKDSTEYASWLTAYNAAKKKHLAKVR